MAKVETSKVAQVSVAAKPQAAEEAAAPKAGPLDLVKSPARSLVLHETRDAAILAARALECKPFGAFSFVCRMLRMGGVSDETFGGLPVTVELDGEEGELASPPGLEAGANIASPDDNAGYLPSSWSDEELVPDPPGVRTMAGWKVMRVEATGLMMRAVEPVSWKVLILVMFATGMLGMVVMSGDRGGLNLEVVMDNEASLQSLVNAALMKSNCRSFHPRHVAVARPQAKRLERFVGICREGVFANWFALQDSRST